MEEESLCSPSLNKLRGRFCRRSERLQVKPSSRLEHPQVKLFRGLDQHQVRIRPRLAHTARRWQGLDRWDNLLSSHLPITLRAI